MMKAFLFSLGFNFGFIFAAAMIMLRRRPASSSRAGQELEAKEKYSADREPYISDFDLEKELDEPSFRARMDRKG